jgi:hypothetical protein
MTTSKYSYIRLEPSDNGGAILSYDEKQEDAKGPYDSCGSISRKEVYTKENIGEGIKKLFSLVAITVEIHEKGEDDGEVVKISIKS